MNLSSYIVGTSTVVSWLGSHLSSGKKKQHQKRAWSFSRRWNPYSAPPYTRIVIDVALRDSRAKFRVSSWLVPPDWSSSSALTAMAPSARRIFARSCSSSQNLEVLCGEGALRNEIRSQMSSLEQAYEPLMLLKNRHVETIFAAFFRRHPPVRYRRECLRMVDGGTVALDWPVMGENEQLWKQKLPRDAPVLILLPGLTGGSHDSYVKHMLVIIREKGWRPVVFNSRGCSDSPVTSPKFYSASFTEDLRQVVRYVAYRFPSSRIYAVGWSLGANILVRYIAQEGEHCLLAAAVSLCNPFNLVIADEDFRKGANKIYDKSLSRSLRKIFRRHVALFEGVGSEYDIQKAANARTVREFDEALTRVSFGYKSVDDYYFDASSSRSIKDVKIPLFCIQAENDPIAPSRGIPRLDIEENTNCLLVVTPTGGHLGWVAGKNAPFGAAWTDPVVAEYLEVTESFYRDSMLVQNTPPREPGPMEIVLAS